MARLWHDYGTIISKSVDESKKMYLSSDFERRNGLILSKEPKTMFKEVGRQFITVFKRKKIIIFKGSPKTGYYCFNDTVNDKLKKKKKKNIKTFYNCFACASTAKAKE